MTVSRNKTIATDASVDAFLKAIKHPTRKADALRLREMMERITGCPPVMWGASIVGFDQYHYKYDSGREGDNMMIGFSPRKASLSLYIMPGMALIETHLKRLGKHKTSKACLYINKLTDVDIEVLEEMTQIAIDDMRHRYPKT
ncbi:MAG: DUF1801 domain-containing protein [Pseudomonadota bacterium]